MDSEEDNERMVHITTNLTVNQEQLSFSMMVPSRATFPEIMEMAESVHNSIYPQRSPIKALDIEIIKDDVHYIIPIREDGEDEIGIHTECPDDSNCQLFLKAVWLQLEFAVKEAAGKRKNELVHQFLNESILRDRAYEESVLKVAELERKVASYKEAEQRAEEEWLNQELLSAES